MRLRANSTLLRAMFGHSVHRPCTGASSRHNTVPVTPTIGAVGGLVSPVPSITPRAGRNDQSSTLLQLRGGPGTIVDGLEGPCNTLPLCSCTWRHVRCFGEGPRAVHVC